MLARAANVLPNRRAPRSHIVRSYARVANYIYPSSASDGEDHLELLMELLDAFENVNDEDGQDSESWPARAEKISRSHIQIHTKT